MTLKEIVEIRLAQMNGKPIPVALKAGLPRDYIRDIVTGKKRRVLDYDGLAKALFLEPAALARGELVPTEPIRTDDDSLVSDEVLDDRLSGQRFEADGVFSESVPYRPKIHGAMPELDMEAGAGEGRVGEIFQLSLGADTISGHRVVAEWKFSDEWIRSEVRASSRKTIVVPVTGDSMRGSYDHGDRVLVDLTQNEFIDGVVFVISVDGGAPSIKRLAEVYEVRPKRWTVISDNPAIPNREVPASIVKIVGRVVGKVSRQ